MELRQLQYVIQIAKEKNFSRAAEKLHIAQPSLSQQLSKLEQEIGVLLFRRTTNSVELTQAGQVFVNKSQTILDAVEQLKQEMDDMAQMRRGRLVVGTLPITGSHILPLVLPVFGAQYPQIEVVLVEDTTTRLEQLTASGGTDLSLLSLPLIDASLSWEPFLEEEICLAVPPQHRLAKRQGPIDIHELQEEPFIGLKRGQGFRQITVELCEQSGFTPQFVFESSNMETIQSLVAGGMGIAFVPQMLTRAKGSDFAPAYLSFTTKPTRTLVIASRKGRYLSKAADAFIRTLNKTLTNYR
ncbi:LysR family transcriptional regulator [Paenibacillus harenae]|uniref:DNA-binding transcriptional LysR family regulator n=1 Tax=Paenibacillus harenae TaxID=306543 RepID=A0ABT9TYE2_PAEHA|nr:LysR family transcriptional regulator [Paenibacillus harenae]MDQ0058130.1 DNA-binding transcriptional LysR family regulator [Paenibacillus harenae]MDQ0111475.1 DNA-binding transcriptional LysR family regulator [Paenibacillus harenae]